MRLEVSQVIENDTIRSMDLKMRDLFYFTAFLAAWVLYGALELGNIYLAAWQIRTSYLCK